MELSNPDFSLWSDRLRLRPLTLEDVDDLYEYQSNADVVRFIPWPQRTKEEVISALEKAITESRLEKEGDYALLGIEQIATKKIIGQMALMYRSQGNSTAEFGYVLNPQFGGQGFATEACRITIEFLFCAKNFHRVFAHLDARNVASENLLIRLGFRKEAHHLQDEYFKGEWTDSMIYALTRAEWLLSSKKSF